MVSNINRYGILAVTLITMTMLIGNPSLFNFTVICMKPEDRGLLRINETSFYTPGEEGWLMAAPPIGLILGTLPAIFLTDQIGMRICFPIFGFASGVATLVFPFFTSSTYTASFLRFIQGVGMASAFVAIGNVPIDYGEVKGKALFVALLSCAYQLGPISAIPLSAVFCESSIGWVGVNYLCGTVTLVSFLLFFVVYRNAPKNSRYCAVSSAQVVPVAESSSEKPINKRDLPPYYAIFTSASVWGIFSTGIGDALAFLIFFYYGPIYVSKVLHFDVGQTGILAALPHFVSMVAKIIAGIFLHKTTYKNTPRVVFLANVILQLLLTVNFLVLIFLASDRPNLAEFLIILTVAEAGLHFIATMCAVQIVAQEHTHVISSAMAALESLFGLLLPPFVSFLAPNHAAQEWTRVFWCVTVCLIATNLMFIAVTKLQPASWTQEHVKMEKLEMES
ncbi:hypothetical protein L596_029144 [Steinernema carpocapsae]|uniref:Major facilitator superfamily (MFS) profile domain-containing protein n=1 Tax=Steinernema carpocapsae TaxID=34508 RepID=A0A4U5LTS4_STECR|nr:hypothetical protein L596_029144 [Steinernema carpocapsae]